MTDLMENLEAKLPEGYTFEGITAFTDFATRDVTWVASVAGPFTGACPTCGHYEVSKFIEGSGTTWKEALESLYAKLEEVI